jgi:hypothetical protein
MLWSLSGLALAASDGPTPVLTGTVNIVLANANGIVVITDSNQTWYSSTREPFNDPRPGQKLFRIDDRTVCTIAGFGSASLDRFPEITSSAAGVVDNYVEQLRLKGGTHSFHEKLTSLRFMFDHLLYGIVNLQQLDLAHAGDYGFELILAGYDTDGTAKIGRFKLSTHLWNGVFSPMVEELKEETVGRELMYETAGLGSGAVEYVLSHPRRIKGEPEVARYAASKASQHGNSLTVAEMEALAKSLARLSAEFNSETYPTSYFLFRAYWPIGGDNQVAILEKGSVRNLEQPRFQERKKQTSFSILEGFVLDSNGLTGTLVGPEPGSILLSVRNKYLGGLILLDNVYYFEDEFRNAMFAYDGGVLGFDPSNRVIDCTLSLGVHADRKSRYVRELIAGFPWKAVN